MLKLISVIKCSEVRELKTLHHENVDDITNIPGD